MIIKEEYNSQLWHKYDLRAVSLCHLNYIHVLQQIRYVDYSSEWTITLPLLS